MIKNFVRGTIAMVKGMLPALGLAAMVKAVLVIPQYSGWGAVGAFALAAALGAGSLALLYWYGRVNESVPALWEPVEDNEPYAEDFIESLDLEEIFEAAEV